MREELETFFFEEFVLFFSVLKWVVIATLVGILVGISTAFFLRVLDTALHLQSKGPYYYLLLPFALLFSAYVIRRIAPEAEGHGTEKVIEAVHERSGRMDVRVIPVKLLSTVITIASGGSVGKEGPAAQIGAGVGSLLATLFRLSDTDRKKVVICGISGGFASVFGTPLSGALFGMEVLFLGSMMYEVILPSFVSGIVAYHTARMLGVSYEYFPLSFYTPSVPYFMLYSVLAGIFFGIVASVFIEVLKITHIYMGKMKGWIRPVAGGVVLVLLTSILSDDYLGLGLDRVHDALTLGDARPYDFLLKMLFTSITLAAGGSGGIITPLFFVGSTSGVLFAKALGLSAKVFAALGFVGVLAGAANTPISASIMAVEIFGPKIGPYAAIVSVISFLITGHRSVYPSQRVAISKSPSVGVEIGAEVEDVKPVIRPTGVGLLRSILNLLMGLKRKKKRG